MKACLCILFVISMAHIWKKLARKLHRIILFHFGLVTFRIHFGKDRAVIILMVFGPSGRDHDSQTNYSYLWRHQDTPKNPRTNPNHIQKILFWGHSKSWQIHKLYLFGKAGPEQSRRSAELFLENEYGINIFQKT